jgi:hypothetical protein
MEVCKLLIKNQRGAEQTKRAVSLRHSRSVTKNGPDGRTIFAINICLPLLRITR